jgi:hypothetical protein
MDPARELSLGFGMIKSEGGRRVARIACRRCCWVAVAEASMLRGLYGNRLYRSLLCSACGARDADVSIRWETRQRVYRA